MRTAFFFGAGCSYGTLKLHKGCCPPIACDFGPQIAERVGKDYEREYPRLAEVARHIGKALCKIGLEEIWTCIDYHAKFQAAFRTAWEPRGKVISELKSALLLLYGKDCDEAAQKLALPSSKGLGLFRGKEAYTLGGIVNRIRPGDTLISFNYDTLVEQLCLRSHLNLRHSNAASGDGIVRFSKPHGSASWDLNSLSGDLIDGPPVTKSLDKDRAKDGAVDPLMLGAVPIKSELIHEVQAYFGVPRVFDVILSQWRAVADAVRDADRLVVLGYSFPPEDTYGRFFFREGMGERKCGAPLRVDYYERTDREEQTACSIRTVLPGVSSIHYCGEVKPAPVLQANGN